MVDAGVLWQRHSFGTYSDWKLGCILGWQHCLIPWWGQCRIFLCPQAVSEVCDPDQPNFVFCCAGISFTYTYRGPALALVSLGTLWILIALLFIVLPVAYRPERFYGSNNPFRASIGHACYCSPHM